MGRLGEPIGFHSHHAVQISLPFSGSVVRLRRPGEGWSAYTAAVVAARQPHAFEARGEFVGLIFVEPESREGRTLHQRSLGEGILPLAEGTLDNELEALVLAYNRTAPDPEIIICARAVIAKLAATGSAPIAALDERIEHAVELIRGRLDEPVRLAQIADAVFLSPDRFRHLFIEETGIRFRPYVLWLRIELALAAYAAGKSLTEASHAGGFADSAHFSRTFRRMFGIAPASLQRE